MDATGDTPHWGLSRSLYRVAIGSATTVAIDERERVRILDATEYAARRLVDNPSSARCVRRWLYREIRGAYALEDLPTLCALLGRVVDPAAELVETMRAEHSRPCAALTRGGAPCQRQARHESDYCPSHRHLDWTDEPAVAAAA